MFGALLIVFVLSSDPPERTRAFATATREVLGSSSEVRIEEEPELPDERRAAELPADVIVELSPGDSADGRFDAGRRSGGAPSTTSRARARAAT
jgi:hypothetical protein